MSETQAQPITVTRREVAGGRWQYESSTGLARTTTSKKNYAVVTDDGISLHDTYRVAGERHDRNRRARRGALSEVCIIREHPTVVAADLQELAAEAARQLSDATDAARALRDRAASVAANGVRDGDREYIQAQVTALAGAIHRIPYFARVESAANRI